MIDKLDRHFIVSDQAIDSNQKCAKALILQLNLHIGRSKVEQEQIIIMTDTGNVGSRCFCAVIPLMDVLEQ